MFNHQYAGDVTWSKVQVCWFFVFFVVFIDSLNYNNVVTVRYVNKLDFC